MSPAATRQMTVIKEQKLRPKIDAHDYETKKRHVVRFLDAGHKVKVTIMFRGREQSRPELGFRLLQRLSNDVAELGFVETSAKQDGRNMTMVLAPHRNKPKGIKDDRTSEPVASRWSSQRSNGLDSDSAGHWVARLGHRIDRRPNSGGRTRTDMPKNKTHRGTAKRVKVSATGKLLRQRAGKRHLLEKKSSRVTRRLDGGSRGGHAGRQADPQAARSSDPAHPDSDSSPGRLTRPRDRQDEPVARVKRAVNAQKKRRTTLEAASGYRGQRSRLYRKAKEQILHSMQYAYRDRRARKGDFRQLWITRINAAARQNGMTYNRLIQGLRIAEVEVDRKNLAELAVSDPTAFTALVKIARAHLPVARGPALRRPRTATPPPECSGRPQRERPGPAGRSLHRTDPAGGRRARAAPAAGSGARRAVPRRGLPSRAGGAALRLGAGTIPHRTRRYPAS